MLKRREILALSAGTALYGLAAPLGRARAQGEIPAGYPADYAAIIEGSKAENGLLFYSGVANAQIQPVIAGFKERYPWIDVQHLEINNYEMIERYLNEVGTGSPTAGILFTAAPDAWLKMIERGQVMDYASPETPAYPDHANSPHPGLYTGGGDPSILIWNKLLVPPELAPTGMEDLVEKVRANPDLFNGRLTTYGAHLSGFGYSLHYALARFHGEKIWDWYRVLGPQTRFERSVGSMIEKTQAGEYVAGYIVANQTARVVVKDPAVAEILGLSYIHDGSPLTIRGLAVTAAAPSPNSAKLMLDFLLSREGQILYATEGKLPARMDITREDIDGGDTLTSFTEEVGAENIALVDYDPAMVTDYEPFLARWKEANGVE